MPKTPGQMVVMGASGFLGRAVCSELVQRNNKVIAAYRTETPTIPGAENLRVSDYREIPVSSESVCIHLAEPPVLDQEDKSLTELNCWVASQNFKKIIYASSAAVYGDKSPKPVEENSELNPQNSYARMKIKHENIFLAKKGTVLRFSNIYGPGMSAKNVLSHILQQIPSVTVQTFSPVRDYLHISDAAKGVALIAEGDSEQIYNLSTGIGSSVSQLLDLIEEICGKKISRSERNKSSEVSELVLNSSKMKNEFFWNPQVDLRQGLAELLKIKGLL